MDRLWASPCWKKEEVETLKVAPSKERVGWGGLRAPHWTSARVHSITQGLPRYKAETCFLKTTIV